MESKNFCTSFLSWDVVLLPLEKLFYFFFSCFLFLEAVSLPLHTSIAVPWVRVSNAFYASLRLLKAGNSGGLPSLSLLVFRYFYVRESPVWTLFGAFLANLLVILSSASGGGQAHQFCRPSSLAWSGLIQPYPCLQVPVFLLFVSRTYQQFSSMGGHSGKSSSPWRA